MTPFEAVLLIEAGEDDAELTLEAWQILIDSGLVWQLQGYYGRTASALIAEGLCVSAN
jgi:hypothetical protein